jgi:hypothetical protein
MKFFLKNQKFFKKNKIFLKKKKIFSKKIKKKKLLKERPPDKRNSGVRNLTGRPKNLRRFINKKSCFTFVSK